jgi:molecular chaperone GrpE
MAENRRVKRKQKMDNNQDIKIQQLEERNLELENNWKRAVADYRNLERRVAEEQMTFLAFANGALLRQLLPIVDTFELASAHLKDEGLTLAFKKMETFLEEVGVTTVKTDDALFDAITMEAVEMVPGEKNKVITVCEKGYMLGDKLLRAAKVNVGNG